MKSILLASASIVGLTIAGAAQAEVTFSGEATLGYNDTDAVGEVDDGDTVVDESLIPGDDIDDDEGFYWDATLNVTFEQMLDSGLVAGASVAIDLADASSGLDLESADYVLSLTSDAGGFYFGVTDFAAQTYWNEVGDMEYSNFSEADGEIVIRSELTIGMVTAGVSYVIADAGGDLVADDPFVGAEVDQLSVGAVGTFGNFTVGMAYQEASDAVGDGVDLDGDGSFADEVDAAGVTVYDPMDENGDFSADEVFGIFGSTTFGGADVALGYVSNNTVDETSTGISISYPFGPVVLGASYVSNSDVASVYELTVDYSNGPIVVAAAYSDNEDGTDEEFSIEGSYDAGNGLMVYAGVLGGNGADPDYYTALGADLGGGAMFTASYAVDDDASEEDEIGDPEYQEGLTFEFSFEF